MSTSPKIVLVGGGVRSGKSAFAVELAQRLGESRAFVATARAYDEEMAERIRRHQRERGDRFRCYEEPEALPELLERLEGHDVVVVDCLTLWISNMLLGRMSVDYILARVDQLVETLRARRFHAVLVTNEVGMSVHPETALGRKFQDVTGWAHQRLSRASDDIYLAVLGTVLHVHPSGLTAGVRG